MVGKLREMTNAGLMDCKKALAESNGDMQGAVDILRKKGVATAAKKAGREAREGVIAQFIQPGGRLGVLVEVNCETDFVAKNETFRAFCDEVARKLAADADRQASFKNYDRALQMYDMAIPQLPPVAQPVVFQKRQEALRAKHIDEGEKAHKLGNFAQAASSYREALRIRTDEALAEKIRLAEAGKYLSNKDDQ